MNKKFWLTNIDVQKSPGFSLGSFPPIKKLGSTLNIIWGPNAVGKSTLSRAMRALIWETPKNEELVAEGTLATENEKWKLSNSQGKLLQTRLRDNKEIDLPGRNDELSESYWFILHELLQEKENHSHTFLQEVRTRMQGGVDINKACENAGGIDSFSRSTISLNKQVKAADEKVKEILKDQNQYHYIKDSIENLEKEIAERDVLTQKKNTLTQASSLIDTNQKIRQYQEKLASYHESIEHVDKTSFQRLQELKKNKERAENDIMEAERVLKEQENDLSSCEIDDKRINDVNLVLRVKNNFESYEKAVQEREKCYENLLEKTATLEEWETQHKWLIDVAPEKGTLKDHITTLKHLASECEPLRCSVDSHTRLCAQLGTIEEISTSREDLISLSVRLSDLIDLSSNLQGTSEFIHKKKWGKKSILLSTIAILTITAFIGIIVHPISFIIGSTLLLGILFFIVPTDIKNPEFSRKKRELENKQNELEKYLTQLGKKPPLSWDIPQYRELLHSLGKEIQDNYLVEQQNQRIIRAEKQCEEAIKNLERWAQKWDSAVHDIGLPSHDSRLDGAQFFHFAQRLEQWSEIIIDKKKALASFLSAEKHEKESRELLQTVLETTETNYSTLKGESSSFIERLQEAKRLQKMITDNTAQLEVLAQRDDDIDKALQKFWKDAHLPVNDEITLKELSSLVDEYHGITREAKFHTDTYRTESEKYPLAFELSKTLSQEEITSLIDEIESSLEAILKKNNELGGLQTTYERLIKSSELSEAQLEKQQAIIALNAFRETEVMGRMISHLATRVKEESEHKFQPQVLKHASEWLSKITNYRYQLFANNDGFFVTDSLLSQNFTLDQLSSGTRIQLLFSIRMAFITLQEETSGVNLPIFLDELLANSDDKRSIDIISAIGEIAKERQVFYFTAQRDEVEKLKTIIGNDITIIALEDEKRQFKADTSPLKPFSFKDTPLVEPMEDYYEYGKALLVPGASLWEPVSTHHSWHLFNDGIVLYPYLQKGLRSIGQIIASTQNQEPPLLLRFQLLEIAQKTARIGRSRKLHIQDLCDPGLSLNQEATYWVQMQEVVGEEGISGEELLQAIEDKRIKRFHSTTQEILTSWLTSNEFITDETPKSEKEIIDNLFVQFKEFAINSEGHRIVERWIHSVLS